MGRGILTAALLLAAISAVASMDAAGDSDTAEHPGPAANSPPADGAAAAADSEGSPAGAEAAGPPAAGQSQDADQPPRRLFTGRVVLLLDALKRRKIETSEEELKGQVVLETADGDLIPIVPDWRGRAFFQDERLRNRKVDLVGYRPAGTPYLKVLMVFTFDEDGQRQYTDYWCDICSIPMYEIQRCECCQGPVRLRYQPQDLPEYLKSGPEDDADAGDGAAPDESGTVP